MHDWHIVFTGSEVLGVFGSACADMALECQRRIQKQTGFATYIRMVRTETRPRVGDSVERWPLMSYEACGTP